MTRTEFLEKCWEKYPLFALSSPPTEHEWMCGRIEHVEAGGASIQLLGESLPIDSASSRHIPRLGEEIPAYLLIRGDVVAYNKDLKAVFLLSPCLSDVQDVSGWTHWQMFIHAVHDYFGQSGFIHWLTPTFVESSGVDANIDFFTARGVRTGREYNLPTSPEFELKKALVCGLERVYEIKKCFRDDDVTSIHQPEFTMLEWYRAYASLDDVEKDVLFLIQGLIENFALAMEVAPFDRWTIQQLFSKYLDFTLTPHTTEDELKAVLLERQWDFLPSETWNDLFFRLYVQGIEPHLEELGLIIVSGFPAQQSSLARITPEGWADRFEFYWKGVEIANAYQEETDPSKMGKTVYAEKESRHQQGKPVMSVGADFLRTMEQGLPPSAGIALGLDRLFMCLMGMDRIVR